MNPSAQGVNIRCSLWAVGGPWTTSYRRYFCNRKLPTNIASMPEEYKLRTASRGVHTRGSPNRLKDVLSSTGRPVALP